MKKAIFFLAASLAACIQTFAQTLGLTTPEFAEAALSSTKPVDLGTRCTVFMNSKGMRDHHSFFPSSYINCSDKKLKQSCEKF